MLVGWPGRSDTQGNTTAPKVTPRQNLPTVLLKTSKVPRGWWSGCRDIMAHLGRNVAVVW